MPTYVAVDLGAESGRVLAGEFDGERLVVSEAHRFPNVPVRILGGLHWDVLRLLAETRAGIGRVVGERRVVSVGVDAWGNDFGLLDRDQRLVANPRHHRDPYTAGLTALVSSQEHYEVTGVQALPINTSCQLLAHAGSPLLDAADRLVMLPDLFTLWLSGETLTERTIASTSQLLDARTGRWAGDLIARLGLPSRLFGGEIVEPGTIAGPLRDESGRPGKAVVVAVAGHDTASAVAALPAVSGSSGSSGAVGYVSCGTWSLVGVETAEPITTPESRLAGFTNEGGVLGTVRFLRNLNGLWLLQECRRAWGTGASYADLVAEAEAAPAFGPLIDPTHLGFLKPEDMPAQVAAFCRATGQPVPEGRAAMVRCILESLACSYRLVLEQAEELTGRPVEAVHLVGGGAASDMLCRLTADIGGRPVLAGPVEATGIGNLLVQVMAHGGIGSLDELREVVHRSYPPRTYLPDSEREPYDATYVRFHQLTAVDNFWSKVASQRCPTIDE
ncbi:rhamnulokinase [Nonomuraea polychroma]|uniref:Rhamnulokinase n=1 Tax=Nonomuraea polychroma TaxID=46176 RepID=A0A438M1Z3_9ACTN|nr:rhamnulokinase family protein [Nonomuraea polychroma]RVX39850.1 rhamnulokinase [Nonomuraea polychroma]